METLKAISIAKGGYGNSSENLDFSSLGFCNSLLTLELDVDRSCSGFGITGLGKLINLTSLTIGGFRKFTSLSGFENLTSLTNLIIIDCGIIDLTPISDLTDLTVVNLRGNKISALKPLENLKSVTSLNLENNVVGDTSSYMESVYKNLEIIANLNSKNGGSLVSIYLNGNSIIDFSLIKGLEWSDMSGF